MDTSDYSALHACVKDDAVEVAKLLLDGSMDFEGYQQWAAARHYGGYKETIQALADHWAELQAAMEPESVSY